MANHLTQFDPFGDLARFDPFRGIDELFRDFRLKNLSRDMDARPVMRLDVSETDQAYTVRADLPGINKDDIKVDIAGNRVSIAAEIRRESEQGATVLRTERYVGQHYRSFTLDQEIDDGAAQARYQDGVLELTLPKRPSSGARKLIVN